MQLKCVVDLLPLNFVSVIVKPEFKLIVITPFFVNHSVLNSGECKTKCQLPSGTKVVPVVPFLAYIRLYNYLFVCRLFFPFQKCVKILFIVGKKSLTF